MIDTCASKAIESTALRVIYSILYALFEANSPIVDDLWVTKIDVHVDGELFLFWLYYTGSRNLAHELDCRAISVFLSESLRARVVVSRHKGRHIACAVDCRVAETISSHVSTRTRAAA